MPEPIRIAVIDDHPLFREGVCLTMRGIADMTVVGQGATADDAVRICQLHAPDVVLLDVHMPGGGCQAARTIHETCVATKIIMLTVSDSVHDIGEALRHGVSGYVLKGTSGNDLLHLVRQVLNGGSHVFPGLTERPSPPNAQRVTNPAVGFAQVELSRRQAELLQMLSKGLTNKEIGTRLGLNRKTIGNYIGILMRKLSARNRVEAILFGSRCSEVGVAGQGHDPVELLRRPPAAASNGRLGRDGNDPAIEGREMRGGKGPA